MTIGGGGKIGGISSLPIIEHDSSPESKHEQGKTNKNSGPQDSFENNLQRRSDLTAKTPYLGEQQAPLQQTSANFKTMMDSIGKNPRIAKQYVLALQDSNAKAMKEFQQLKQQTMALMKQLAQAGGNEEAMRLVNEELQRLRERMKHIRQSIRQNRRRMKALKTIAGKVSKPSDDAQLENLLEQIYQTDDPDQKKQLKLKLSSLLFNQTENAPAHLEQLSFYSVEGSDNLHELSEYLAEYHPILETSSMLRNDIAGEAAMEQGGSSDSEDEATAAMEESITQGSFGIDIKLFPKIRQMLHEANVDEGNKGDK